MEKRRVTIKYKCPNPMFEKWLTEWMNEAKEKNSKKQYCYSLALKSLRKYPLPLRTGRECKILTGFGDKLCAKLDDALKNHQIGLPIVSNVSEEEPKTPKKIKAKTKKAPSNTPRNSINKTYTPSARSGSYAILIALYESSLNPDYPGFSLKTDLVKAAQVYCDASFTKPESGTFYTAWSSMKTLIDKELVMKEGNPARFSLTDQGIVMGHKLYRECKREPKNFIRFNTDEIIDSNLISNEPILADNVENICNNSLKSICGTFDLNTNTDISKPSTSKVDVNLKTKLVKSNDVISQLKIADKEPKPSTSKDNLNVKSKPIKNKSNDKLYEDVIFAPNSFDIVLLVDNCETVGKKSTATDPLLNDLNDLNVFYEIKNLKVGDYGWICRHRESSVELMLPYIVERKRVDDLSHSIVDGRFHEQKFRLRKSGIQNVIYVVESFDKNKQHLTIPHESLYQATVNTMVQDGFFVKYSDNLKGTAKYLASMTNLIIKNYKEKTIVSCPKENLSPISIDDDLISLMTFKEFNKAASKTKTFTVKDMLVKHLLRINGVSVDKALAITDIYSTPLKLIEALKNDSKQNGSVIAGIKYGTLGNKIGPVMGNVIYQFFTKDAYS